MTKISSQEVRKIAHMSNIEIKEKEVEKMQQQLGDVLSYAERVKEVAQDITQPSNKNVNVWREDVIVRCDYEPILAQAPERAGNFFVVPKIIEHS